MYSENKKGLLLKKKTLHGKEKAVAEASDLETIFKIKHSVHGKESGLYEGGEEE